MRITFLCGVLGVFGSCPDTHSHTSEDDQQYIKAVFDAQYAVASNFMQRYYGYGKEMHDSAWHEQSLDINLPNHLSTDAATFHTLIYLHGGGFKYGNRKEPTCVGLVDKLADNGWLTAAIEYREEKDATDGHLNASYNTEHSFMGAMDSHQYEVLVGCMDARAAMRYIMHWYCDVVDLNNLFVGGGSAGAITSLHIGYGTRSNQHECDHLTCDGSETHYPTIGRIQGVIAVSGGLDTSTALSENNGHALFGDSWNFANMVSMYGEHDAGYVKNYIAGMERFAGITAFEVPGGAHLPIVPYNFHMAPYNNDIDIRTDPHGSGDYWCTLTGLINDAKNPTASASLSGSDHTGGHAAGGGGKGGKGGKGGGGWGWGGKHRRQSADVFV